MLQNLQRLLLIKPLGVCVCVCVCGGGGGGGGGAGGGGGGGKAKKWKNRSMTPTRHSQYSRMEYTVPILKQGLKKEEEQCAR